MKVHIIGAFFNQTMEFSKHPVATARAQHSLSSGGGEKRECATHPQCVYILGSFFLQDFLVRFSQVRFSQARFSQVRSSQLQLRQVGLGQVRLDQVQLQYKLDILFLPEEERRGSALPIHSVFTFWVHFFCRIFWLGLVRLGLVRLGLVRLGPVSFSYVRLGQVRLGQIRYSFSISQIFSFFGRRREERVRYPSTVCLHFWFVFSFQYLGIQQSSGKKFDL